MPFSKLHETAKTFFEILSFFKSHDTPLSINVRNRPKQLKSPKFRPRCRYKSTNQKVVLRWHRFKDQSSCEIQWFCCFLFKNKVVIQFWFLWQPKRSISPLQNCYNWETKIQHAKRFSWPATMPVPQGNEDFFGNMMFLFPCSWSECNHNRMFESSVLISVMIYNVRKRLQNLVILSKKSNEQS